MARRCGPFSIKGDPCKESGREQYRIKFPIDKELSILYCTAIVIIMFTPRCLPNELFLKISLQPGTESLIYFESVLTMPRRAGE